MESGLAVTMLFSILISLVLILLAYVSAKPAKANKIQKSKASRIFLSLGWASLAIFQISMLAFIGTFMVLFLMLGLFLLYWGLCGVVADIALSKKRDWALFYGLSALLTPPIMIIVVSSIREPGFSVSKSTTRSTPRRGSGQYGTDYLPCPFCAEDVKVAAVLCKHCGSSLVIDS